MQELEEISVSQESIGTYSLEYLNTIVNAIGSTSGSISLEFLMNIRYLVVKILYCRQGLGNVVW